MSGVDYEHELNNGWDKWQNLVLSALKENRDATLVLDSKLDDLRVEVARGGERHAALEALAHSTDARVTALETRQTSTETRHTQAGSFIKGVWMTLGVIGAAACGVGGLAIGLAQLYFG